MSNRTLTLLMGMVAVIILVVGGIFVAVALGGGGDDSTSASPGSTPKPNSSGTSTSGVTGDICKSNTLVTYGNDPATLLDPIQVRYVEDAQYVLEVFSGLVTLDLNLKVQPDIAASWKVSPDGKAYTFTLRDNVVFQNNRRLTAQDVKYSLERAADPANNSPTVVQYLGNIVGLRDRYNNKAKDVSGVKVIDDRTIEIDLNEPADFFLAELAQPVAFVVDKDQIAKDPRNWTRTPNGTGPFKMTEFTPNEVIRLQRFDRFYNGPAKIDGVVFELAGGSIVARYQNNEVHVGLVPPADVDSVKSGKSPLSADYKPQPEMGLEYIAFNVKQAPFDDPLVRQALAMSIDREKINSVLYYGTQRVADGILPPEMPGYAESVSSYKYDVAKAKQLLQDSKYAGKLPRITLTYTGGAGAAPDTLQAIQSGWKDDLGIDVQLQAVDATAYIRELRKGSYQMFDAGWIADYPDPEDFLEKLWQSDSPQNEQGYNNAQVDTLLKQARVEQDQTKRFTLYRQAEQMILDDAAIIPQFWPVEHNLVKSCVTTWPSTSMAVEKYRFVEINGKK